jgi:hypothetical protein
VSFALFSNDTKIIIILYLFTNTIARGSWVQGAVPAGPRVPGTPHSSRSDLFIGCLLARTLAQIRRIHTEFIMMYVF